MWIGISERFGERGHDLAHVARVARAIEARGFDSLWAPEHLAVIDDSPRGERVGYQEAGGAASLLSAPSFPDPFVTLTAAAAAAPRLLVGTAVLLAALHSPFAIARAGATLDALSGGRFVLGAGVGWQRDEYEALGVPWEQRGARTTEHLEAVLALWTKRPASFAGASVAFDRVLAEPRPASQPHPPLLIGGNSIAALRRAALLGDGWFGWGLADELLASTLRRLRELLDAAGRDAARFTIQLGARFDGDAQRLADCAAGARRAGVTRLVVSCGPERSAEERSLDTIAAACGLS